MTMLPIQGSKEGESDHDESEDIAEENRRKRVIQKIKAVKLA